MYLSRSSSRLQLCFMEAQFSGSKDGIYLVLRRTRQSGLRHEAEPLYDRHIYLFVKCAVVGVPGKTIFPFSCDGNLPRSLGDCLIVEIKPYFMCPRRTEVGGTYIVLKSLRVRTNSMFVRPSKD